MQFNQTNRNAGDVINPELKSVWLLTVGDGSDGNEWGLLGIYSSKENASEALEYYTAPRIATNGKRYRLEAQIEEKPLNTLPETTHQPAPSPH